MAGIYLLAYIFPPGIVKVLIRYMTKERCWNVEIDDASWLTHKLAQTPIVTSAIRIRFIRLHRTRLPYLVCTKTFSLNVSLSLPIAFIV